MAGPQINTLLSIDAVWMAVSVDDDGTEGLCAFMTPNGWMPLVAADEKRLKDILKMAEIIASEQHRLVRIVKMTTREEIRVFDKRN